MSDKEYVVLRHRCMPSKGLCFFTTNTNDPQVEYGYDGGHWYEVVGYADSVKEAQTMCGQNYGGLPSMKEFEDYSRELIAKRYEKN